MRAEPIELAGVCMAGSAALWAISFWLLRLVPLSWLASGIVAVAGAAVGVGSRRRALRAAAVAWRRDPALALWQTALVAAVIVLRLAFAAVHVAYSGGDMSEHATLSEEIVLADGFPRTQEPLLPIPRFGQVPPGFHALSALVTLWSGAPTYRSTIYILCLAAAAMAFALYALLRMLAFSPAASAAGSLIALGLARNPQFFLQWGGAPSILAAAIGILVLRDLVALARGPSDPGRAVRVGILAAGVLLVHPLPAVGLLWIGLPLAAQWALASQTRGRWRDLARDGAVAALAALLCALPFLVLFARPPSAAAVAWAHDWFLAETRPAATLARRFAPWLGSRGPAIWPFFLVSYLGALPTVLMAGGLAAAWLGARAGAGRVALLVLALEAFLFAGALGEFLPGWPALYPTRTGLWLVIPLGVALAELASLAGRWPRSALRLAAVCWGLAFLVEGWRLSANRFGTAFYGQARDGRTSIAALLTHEAMGGAFWITTFCSDVAAVTPEDLPALAWARTHTPPDAVFANNPGDGGALLPAAAHRKITEPHYYWFFDRPDVEAWRASARIGYVFVGSQPAPAWERRWTAEDLDHDPRVLLAYRSGRARVYRVRDPFGDAFR